MRGGVIAETRVSRCRVKRVEDDPAPPEDYNRARQHNEHGNPVLGYDEHRWEREKARLKYEPVVFSRDQMVTVESLLREICARGGWDHIVGAAGPDHVHELLHSRNDPETIRRLFKRWLGQELTVRLQGEPGCPQPGTKDLVGRMRQHPVDL